jgi:hypothetical protein
MTEETDVALTKSYIWEVTGSSLSRGIGNFDSWSSGQEFLATDPEVPRSIPGATRFSEK